MSKVMNDKHLETVCAVLYFTAKNKHAPSTRELAKLCCIGEKAAEQRVLRLRIKGILVSDGPRTLRLGVVAPAEKARIVRFLEDAERDPSKSFARGDGVGDT